MPKISLFLNYQNTLHIPVTKGAKFEGRLPVTQSTLVRVYLPQTVDIIRTYKTYVIETFEASLSGQLTTKRNVLHLQQATEIILIRHATLHPFNAFIR